MLPARLRFLAIAAVAAAASVPSVAWAFCRTGTCKLDASFNPSAQVCRPPGTDECIIDGAQVHNVPLWWRSECVGFSMQKDGTRHASFDDVVVAAQAAFNAWTTHTCPGAPDASSSKVSIEARYLGPVACADGVYRSDGPNQNAIIFREDGWPHRTQDQIAMHLPSLTVALTTVTYERDTGEIYAAYMELNTSDYPMVLTNADVTGVYDMQSVLTHEAGHFLGMAHSPDMQAVMYYADEGGSAHHRDLTMDDIEGICAIYPPGGLRSVDMSVDPSGLLPETACDPTPRHGFSSDCAPYPSKGGCSASGRAVSDAPASGNAWSAVALGLAVIAVGAARARFARTSKPEA